MTEERTTPLRERMIEDMRIRGLGDKAQQAHIRAIKDFAGFLKRSPDTATPDDLRAYQLHMTNAGVTPTTFNARIVALRLFFATTCGREEMVRHMQFRRQPRKLPVVLSIEEVSDLLMAAPEVSRGAQHFLWGRTAGLGGLQPEDQRHRQRPDADPCRTGQGPEGPQGHAVARAARTLARLLARSAAAGLAVSRQAEDQSNLAAAAQPRLYRRQKHGRDRQAGDAAHIAAQLCHPPFGSEHRCQGDPGPSGPCQADGHRPLTHVATKTIRDTVSPFETLKKLQDQTLRRGWE